MARRKLQTKREQKHEIVRQYRRAHDNRPASTLEIAEWGYRQGLWRPKEVDPVKQLAKLLSDAMREEYFTDPQGRRVRAKHAAPSDGDAQQPLPLWVDIRDASPEARKLVELSFHNRRQLVVGELSQLNTDVGSYNENYNPGEPIPLILDFGEDIAELEFERKLGRNEKDVA